MKSWGESKDAMVDSDDGVFFARRSRQGHATFSAVHNLVQGVYAADPRRAQLRLRGHIVCDAVDDAERALIKVCAGKVTVAESLGHATGTDVTAISEQARESVAERALWNAGVGQPLSRHVFAAGLRWMRNHRERRVSRGRSDRPVLALLADDDSTILWAARNAAGVNKTMHAEMVLLQSWAIAHGALPTRAKIVVSLSPCRMCAAAIVASRPPQKGEAPVLYRRFDPGRYGRSTALSAPGLLQQWCPPRAPSLPRA